MKQLNCHFVVLFVLMSGCCTKPVIILITSFCSADTLSKKHKTKNRPAPLICRFCTKQNFHQKKPKICDVKYATVFANN